MLARVCSRWGANAPQACADCRPCLRSCRPRGGGNDGRAAGRVARICACRWQRSLCVGTAAAGAAPASWVPPCRDSQSPASARLLLARSQAGCLAGNVKSGVGHPFRAAHKLRAGSAEEQLFTQHHVVRVPGLSSDARCAKGARCPQLLASHASCNQHAAV